MKLCPHCAAEIIPGAKFCHRCGDKFVEKTKVCPACSSQSPVTSVFCHDCGFHFAGKHKSDSGYQSFYPLDFDATNLTEQIKKHFFKCLRKRIEEEHDIKRYSDYVERFYDSRFKEIYNLRAEQISDEVWIQWERFGKEALSDIDTLIDDAFDGLLDYFIIQHCPDINGVLLPAAMLKYERSKPNQQDIGNMIHDFMDFNREEELFYFNFISMPEQLLSNACKSFLFAERKEKLYFICDISLKKTCKEGFAMTDKGIYWKCAFNRPKYVQYHTLRAIRKEKDQLLIDGQYFNVNPSINIKLYKLLKKLRIRRPLDAQSRD